MGQNIFFAKLTSFILSLYTEKRCLVCHTPFVPPASLTSAPPACTTLKAPTTPLHLSAPIPLDSPITQCLCAACTATLTQAQHLVCKLCAHTFAIAGRENVCRTCHKRPPPWNSVHAFGTYENILKYCLLQFKFEQQFSMLPLLSEFLYQACAHIPPCHMILPMPRHQQRLATQGFNHTLELSRSVARRLQIPLYKHTLIRTKATQPQVRLSATQRQKNPANSFSVSTVLGKNILLIDDIMTTGATLHHASLALRAAGAKEIHIAIIGRVVK